MFMICTINFWFQTDLGVSDAKIEPAFKCREVSRFMVTRCSCSSSNFCALIGQNLTGEFMLKMYAASGNLFSDSWSSEFFLCSQLVMFLTVFFHWMYKMNTASCYQDSSVLHGWFVYWIYGWEMRRLSKSSKFNLVRHCFRFSPCLMRKRV